VSIRTAQDSSNHSYEKSPKFKIARGWQTPYSSIGLCLFFFLFCPIAVQKWSTESCCPMWRDIYYQYKYCFSCL